MVGNMHSFGIGCHILSRSLWLLDLSSCLREYVEDQYLLGHHPGLPYHPYTIPPIGRWSLKVYQKCRGLAEGFRRLAPAG